MSRKNKKENKKINDNKILHINALEYFKMGEFKKSEKILKKIISIEPNNEMILQILGNVYISLDKFGNAKKTFENIIKINKINFNAYTGLGNSYNGLGNYNKAIKFFKEAISLNPENSEAYSGLASSCRFQKNDEKAIKYFLKAIDISNRLPIKEDMIINIYFNLGDLYLENQDWENAIIWLRKVVNLNNTDFETYYLIGFILRQKGDFEKAIQNLEKSIYIRENNEAYNLLADIYLEQNNLKGAKKYYEILIKRGYRNEFIYFNLGTTYFKLNNLEKSLEYYGKSIILNENKIDVYDAISQVYEKLGNSDKSKEYKEKADRVYDKEFFTENKKKSSAYEALAKSFLEKGDFKNAEDNFLKAIEYMPNDTRIYSNLAVPYGNFGKNSKAEEFFKKSIENDENNIDTYFNLGYFYLKQKRYDEALIAYKKVINLNPNDWEALDSIYKIYYNYLNNHAEANKYKEKLNDLLNNNEDYKVEANKLKINSIKNMSDKEKRNFLHEIFELTQTDSFKVMELIKNKKYKEVNIFLSKKNNKEEILLSLGEVFIKDDYINAKYCYEQLLKIDNKNDKYYYNLGGINLALGNIDKSEYYHKQGISLNNNSAENYRELGYIYEQKRDFEKAKNYYLKAIHINNSDAIAHFNIGTIYHTEKNLNEGKKHYLMAEKLGYKDACINLAELFEELKDFDNSENYYKKAIKDNPIDFTLYFRFALLYFNIKKFNNSIINFKKAIEINPNYIESYKFLSFSYLEQGKTDIAKKYLKKMINLEYSKDAQNSKSLLNNINSNELDEFLNETIDNLIKKYFTNKVKPKKKEDKFFKIIKLNTEASLLSGNGKHKEAIKLLKEAIGLNNNYFDTYNNLGIIYTKMDGGIIRSIPYFEKAIEINPKSKEAYNNLANIYRDIGNLENIKQIKEDKYPDNNKNFHKALKLYKKAIEIDKNYDSPYNGLGMIFRVLGEKENAIIYYKKLIDINPDYQGIYNNIGNIYQDLKNYKSAIKYYKISIEKNAHLGEVYYNLAKIYLIDNFLDLEKAITYLKKGIKNIEIIKVYNPIYIELCLLISSLYFYEKKYHKVIEYNDKIIDFNSSFSPIVLSGYIYLLDNLYKNDEDNSIIKKLESKIKELFIKKEFLQKKQELIYWDKDIVFKNFYKDNVWQEVTFHTLFNVIMILTDELIPDINTYSNIAILLDDKDLESVKYINNIDDSFLKQIYKLENRITDKFLLFLNIRLLFIEIIKNNIFDFIYSKNKKTIEDYKKINNLSEIYITITKVLQESIDKLIKKHNEEKSLIKLEEKDRIIQNLYHNLKNKIPKIYFSIENIIEDLEEEGEKVPNTLRKSLLLTKDLEDTANVVLGASKISKDYLLSAINNNNKQISLKEIINNSILNALSYVPLDRSDINIVNKFSIKNMEEVFSFIKNKLFNIDFNTDYLEYCYLSQEHIIDNKYSVTSILSNMFDELLINLFKYTSKNSFIEVNILNGVELVFILKNSSEIGNKESTGKGRYIIETTIQSIGGKYKHYWEKDIYITEISLNNYWSKND